jgi:hypothetical protein
MVLKLAPFGVVEIGGGLRKCGFDGVVSATRQLISSSGGDGEERSTPVLLVPLEMKDASLVELAGDPRDKALGEAGASGHLANCRAGMARDVLHDRQLPGVDSVLPDVACCPQRDLSGRPSEDV